MQRFRSYGNPLHGRAWRGAMGILCLVVGVGLAAPAAAEPADADLADLQLEDLFNMEVTSLTKSAKRFSDTPAAIYVLTSEDIRRSGVRSIPEALRMVPGLQVAQLSGNKWAISARGFNSIFSDKMLVTIDGRSVYTPLFAGVYWDVQDTLIEDIDRIEVIRGPGGTLWGANAVNGVINIVTKRAADTQGVLVDGGGGNVERGFASARYGGKIGDKVQYRGFFKYFQRTAFDDPNPAAGAFAFDATEAYRGGVRLDTQPTEKSKVTISADFYDGTSDNVAQSILETIAPGVPRMPTVGQLRGGNVLGLYEQGLDRFGELMFKFYYDRSQRFDIVWGEVRNTWDLEFQHSVDLPWSTDMSWGLQYRYTNEVITPGFETTFLPQNFDEDLFTGFLQFGFGFFDERLQILLGSKFIENDHTGFEAQPSIRFAATPFAKEAGWGEHTFWGAITRAVRLPSRSIDDILVQPQGFPVDILNGNRNAISEIVYAFEAGYRVTPITAIQFDLAGYYNLYRDLFSLELNPGNPLGVPLTWANQMEGDGYGIEISVSWQPVPWWQLRVGYTWAELALTALPGSTSAGLPVGIGNPAVSGGVPKNQVQILSSLDLPHGVDFDAQLYYVDDIVLFNINSYFRLDLRLGWQATDWLELYVSGMNLTQNSHQEWAYEFEYTYTLVPRSYLAGATIRF